MTLPAIDVTTVWTGSSALLALAPQDLLNALLVGLGLGLVIFFHELGHFAVAKWCGVQVERFSMGLGPVVYAWKSGETEYALSAIPFGGYVKMLGQDDADPSQSTNEEISANPRSYTAKTVWQRMAIISAGVIMNLITAVIFIAIAFHYGVETLPGVIGSVTPGSPAWREGLRDGDRIFRLNGTTVTSFADIALGVALSVEKVELEGKHADGVPFKIVVTPDAKGTRPQIGVAPMAGLQLIMPADPAKNPWLEGSAASQAQPPFKPGDRIVEVGGKPVASFLELQQTWAERTGPFPPVMVERTAQNRVDKERVTIQIPESGFRTLGLRLDTGPITGIRNDSPAAKAGLKVGDKIARINDRDVGSDLDPLQISEELFRLRGQPVKIVVARQTPGGPMNNEEIELVPENRAPWSEPPSREAGDPLTIPSIGVAYQVIPVVLAVEPNSPAAAAGVQPQSRIIEMSFVLPAGVTDEADKKPISIAFDDGKDPKLANNFPHAYWLLQQLPKRRVKLLLMHDRKEVTVELQPTVDLSRPLPFTGLLMQGERSLEKAESWSSAVVMAYHHTRRQALNIYATLRSLFTGRLSVTELKGPLGIVQQAYEVSQIGWVPLLLFLGFLSINLAVLNFLPIPVLDGGHMVFLLWELVTRRKPSERVVLGATLVGFAFLIGLMGLVIYLDVFYHWLGWHR